MDKLTGLLTRSELNNTSIQSRSILLVDIKLLMFINDAFGHNIGDKIIKEVTEVISSVTEESEVTCRYGGNLFLILSNDINNLQELIDIKIKDFEFTKKIDVKVNFGRSKYNPFDSFQKLFEDADRDLYLNKSSKFN